jgi:hypothetical protein
MSSLSTDTSKMIFEVEPFSPNIGLQSRANTQNEGIKDHGIGAAKDTEMKETENTINSIPSVTPWC